MSKRLCYAEISDLAEREDTFHLPQRWLHERDARLRQQATRGGRDERGPERPARRTQRPRRAA